MTTGPATSSEPTFEDLSTAVDKLTKRVADLDTSLSACHDEIRFLNRENASLRLQLKQARQQRLDDPPRRRTFGIGGRAL